MLIAGPNLTIDRTLAIDEIRPGHVLRFTDAAITPGGKGVNVARAARSLGTAALLVSFVPGHTGAAVAALIRDEGHRFCPIETRGEVRSSAIVMESAGRVTVFNEPGPAISGEDWERYERALGERTRSGEALVCIGSVPPRAPRDAFGRLVALGRESCRFTLVDATGELLAAALPAHPDVVTPNLSEAEAVLFGRADEDVESDGEDVRERALEAALGMVRAGAGMAIVTAGKSGAAFCDDGKPRWMAAPRVTVRNPIGAGDCFVAGFASSLEGGAPHTKALVAGMAAAAAGVETPLAGSFEVARALALARVIEGAAPASS